MACLFANTLERLPASAALAVGTFDGVHVGHQALIRAMRAFAHNTSRTPCILTFSNSPNALLAPQRTPGRILQEQAFLHELSTLLPDGVLLCVPFDHALADLSAQDFANRLRGTTVFCGEDWRFGAGAEGTPDFLKAQGFDVRVIPYATWQGERVSSTRIRASLATGRLDDVSAMLSRPWSFEGRVIHGRKLARELLGIPTANIPYLASPNEPPLAPLAHGVYVASATTPTSTRPALVNFGVAPSIKNESLPLFEAYLLDVEEELYDSPVRLSFSSARIRPEEKFASVDALKAQVLEDLKRVREASEQEAPKR